MYDGVSATSGTQPVVVVTGASAGVGRAVAVAFARRGWSVGLIARGRDRLESASREVERAGGRAIVLQADVSDAEALEAAAAQVVGAFGRIDFWVNSAMVTVYAPVAAISPEEVKRVTEVTYLGQVYGTLAALQHMRRRNRGTIVQIGSALAYRSIPLQSAYCAAKAAVRGFTDSLRVSSCMSAVVFVSPWSNCQRSIHRSLLGRAAIFPSGCSPCPQSTILHQSQRRSSVLRSRHRVSSG